MILACFVLGLSTRKVATALLPVLGRPVSPATVSAVAKQLDAAVAAFHRRPLKDSTGCWCWMAWCSGARPAPARWRGRAGGARSAPRRQEGGHRLPPGHRRERRPMGAVPRRSGPPRPGRRAPGDALRRRRLGPARRLAHGLSRYPGAALLGAQDPQRPEQGPQARPGGDQGQPASDHERHDAAGRLVRRAPLRRALGEHLSQGGGMSAHRPRRPARPASATGPSRSARPCAPPTPSSAASARSAAAPARWAPSRTALPWTASCSPCSCTKTATRASPPPSP